MLALKKVFSLIFIQSWWVIAFILCCAIFYENNLEKRELFYQQLIEKQQQLKKEKLAAIKKQENLKHQINSQSDLSWVELTLMRGLGVVPEGQQKIYFEKQNLN